MKYLVNIALVTVLIITTAFITKEDLSKGVKVGNMAPDIELGEIRIKPSEVKDKYTLISFWTSYDINSRIENVRLHEVAKKNDLEIISISFDKYESIFNEVSKKDNTNGENSFCVTDGNKSKVYKTYKIDRGNKNFLINKEGKIIARNISHKEVMEHIN